MSTTVLDIFEVHSLGCTSTNSEDSSLGTTTHSSSNMDMYQVYSLPCPKYENPSKCCYNDESPPRLQCLKSQPPGGQYNTAKVSKSPTKADMYKSSSEWRVFYLALPKSLYKVTLASLWYKIKTPRWNEFCLAQLRSLRRDGPCLQGVQVRGLHPVVQGQVMTPSKWRKIKSFSSSCPEVSKTPVPEVSTPGRA